MITSTISDYAAPATDAIPCVTNGLQPGLSNLQRWSTAPIPGITNGNDAPNTLDLAFGAVDADGFPTCNVAYAPTLSTVAQASTGNPGGFAALISDCWILLPVGVVSRVWLQDRKFGTCGSAIYAGPSLLGMTRRFWVNGNASITPPVMIHVGDYPEICSRKLMRVKLYSVNGYLNGGWILQYSTDNVTFVDVPAVNVWGSQPFAT